MKKGLIGILIIVVLAVPLMVGASIERVFNFFSCEELFGDKCHSPKKEEEEPIKEKEIDTLIEKIKEARINANATVTAGGEGDVYRVLVPGGGSMCTPGGAAGGTPASYTGKFAEVINAEAQKAGIDPNLVAAIIQAESNFVETYDSGGRKGLMGLPAEAITQTGVKNPLAASENVAAGVQYLKERMAELGSVELAVAEYKWGQSEMQSKGTGPNGKDWSKVSTVVPQPIKEYVEKVTKSSATGTKATGSLSVKGTGAYDGPANGVKWSKIEHPMLTGDTDIHPILAERLIKLTQAKNEKSLKVISGGRTYEEQVAVKKSNPYLGAEPGKSKHEIGAAVDIDVKWLLDLTDADLQPYGLHKPVMEKGENWHIEPLESGTELGRSNVNNKDLIAKLGGLTPTGEGLSIGMGDCGGGGNLAGNGGNLPNVTGEYATTNRFNAVLYEMGTKHGVDPFLLKAIMAKESNGLDQYRVNDNGNGNCALGYMQFLTSCNAADRDQHINDVRYNLEKAILIIKSKDTVATRLSKNGGGKHSNLQPLKPNDPFSILWLYNGYSKAGYEYAKIVFGIYQEFLQAGGQSGAPAITAAAGTPSATGGGIAVGGYKTADPNQWLTGDWKGVDQTFAGRLAAWAQDKGKKITVTSGLRSVAEQEVLYNLYLSGKGNLAAKPGTSRHNYGLAVDVSGWAKTDYKSSEILAYGLHKPLENNEKQKEDWHIEPIETKGMNVTDMKKLASGGLSSGGGGMGAVIAGEGTVDEAMVHVQILIQNDRAAIEGLSLTPEKLEDPDGPYEGSQVQKTWYLATQINKNQTYWTVEDRLMNARMWVYQCYLSGDNPGLFGIDWFGGDMPCKQIKEKITKGSGGKYTEIIGADHEGMLKHVVTVNKTITSCETADTAAADGAMKAKPLISLAAQDMQEKPEYQLAHHTVNESSGPGSCGEGETLTTFTETTTEILYKDLVEDVLFGFQPYSLIEEGITTNKNFTYTTEAEYVLNKLYQVDSTGGQ